MPDHVSDGRLWKTCQPSLGQNQQMATLFLIVGLPGAERTAQAKEFAALHLGCPGFTGYVG